jgi:hypothetical protein
VPLSSAIYDPSAYTITLVPKGKLNKAQPNQLKIAASLLKDWLGRPIDGNHDGQPGGDLVATLKGKSVNIAAVGVARAASASPLAVEAIDRVITGNSQLVTRPVRSIGSRSVGRPSSSLATVVSQSDSGFTIVHWPVLLRDESQREGLADQGDASPSGRAA